MKVVRSTESGSGGMIDWETLNNSVAKQLRKLNSNPNIPQWVKERKIKIAPGSSMGGEIPYPAPIKEIKN